MSLYSFNGQAMQAAAETLADLLLQQGYDGNTKAMACAVNGQFVPRSQWADHLLCDGDRIDVVAPVTGG